MQSTAGSPFLGILAASGYSRDSNGGSLPSCRKSIKIPLNHEILEGGLAWHELRRHVGLSKPSDPIIPPIKVGHGASYLGTPTIDWPNGASERRRLKQQLMQRPNPRAGGRRCWYGKGGGEGRVRNGKARVATLVFGHTDGESGAV
ncbi:predicted protein [Histoplasma capsulatum H143]|uniref:Uncharacterized protein n=1 Tax=Ajellomyces capsulatus (strain H143) TaxID=544712 RepID=C6HRU2_AJECH|nr:predicted protein [Histoplasma capsulatum H143]